MTLSVLVHPYCIGAYLLMIVTFCLTAEGHLLTPDTKPYAIVVKSTAITHEQLKLIAEFDNNERMVLNSLQADGYVTLCDPSHHCFAVSRRMKPEDNSLIEVNNLRVMQACRLIDSITVKQLQQREYGYVKHINLTENQKQVVLSLIKADTTTSVNNDDGDYTISLGLWPVWLFYCVTFLENGYPECRTLKAVPAPPSISVIDKPPLQDNILWWAWPHNISSLTKMHVTIPLQCYTIEEVAALLEKVADIDVSVDTLVKNIEIFITAKDISLDKLLWAIEIATGAVVSVIDGERPMVLFETNETQTESYRDDLRRQLFDTRDGIYLLGESIVGQHLLPDFEGGGTYRNLNWIGWNFDALPFLYKNCIRSRWEQQVQHHRSRPHYLYTTSESRVMWVKAVRLRIIAVKKERQRNIEIDIPFIK